MFKDKQKIKSINKKDMSVCIIAAVLSILVWIPTYFYDGDNLIYMLPISWIWMLSLLICVRKAGNFSGYLISFVAVWLSTTFIVYGLYGTGITELIPNLISSIIIFPAFLADSLLKHKYNRFALTLVFPLLYTLLTIVISTLHIGSNLRMDLYLSPLLVPYQIVSIIGAYGLSFLLVWLLTCILYAIQNRKDYDKLKTAIICPVVVILVLTFGFMRLYMAPQADFTFKAAYAVGPYRGDFIDYEDVSYQDKVEYFTSSCRSAAKEGATFITFTEEAFCLGEDEAESFIALAKKEALANHIAVLLGLELEFDSDDALSKNEILWIDSNGKVKTEYIKSHLIPVIEEQDYESGDNIIPYIDLTVDDHDVRVSMSICFDADDPLYTYTLDPKTDIFILPSWDWDLVQKKHTLSTSYMPLQNHVTFLKATYDGYSSVTDSYGRSNYFEKIDTRNSNVRIVEIPIIHS